MIHSQGAITHDAIYQCSNELYVLPCICIRVHEKSDAIARAVIYQ